MKAHLEPITFVIRVFDEGKDFGDPYAFSATLIRIDKNTVKFMGVDKQITIEMWRALDLALYEAGFKYFTFEHRNKTSFRKVRGLKNVSRQSS
jgi:hypothetical protein